MSIGSTLKHLLGFVAGILIPGASAKAVDAIHEVQQHFAELFGEAATALANSLKLDTAGISGPDKVFYIGKALVETAKAQGFKGDLKVLKTATLDVAQTVYRNSLPSICSGTGRNRSRSNRQPDGRPSMVFTARLAASRLSVNIEVV